MKKLFSLALFSCLMLFMTPANAVSVVPVPNDTTVLTSSEASVIKSQPTACIKIAAEKKATAKNRPSRSR